MIRYIKDLNNRKLKEWLEHKYIKEKLQQKDIARLCGVGRNTIHNWLEYYQIPFWGKGETRKKKPCKIINLKVGDRYRARDIGFVKYRNADLFEWVECPICNKKHWVLIRHNKPVNLCCLRCGIAKKTPTVNKDGYEDIWISPTNPFAKMRGKRGRILVHRLNMAKHLNRCLKTEEIVHHIDHNKTNNNISNLKLIESGGPHLSITILENKIKRLETKNKLLKRKINEFKSRNIR